METIRSVNDPRLELAGKRTPGDGTVYEVEARKGDEAKVERFSVYAEADAKAMELWLEGWHVVLRGVIRWTVYTLKETDAKEATG